MPVKPGEIKAECNRAHAAMRAAERYGIELSREALAALEETIHAGGSESCCYVRPDGNKKNRAHWAVKLDGGEWLPLVYDTATKSIVSFLPAHALDPYRQCLESPQAVVEEVRDELRTCGPIPPSAPPIGDVSGPMTVAEIGAALERIGARKVELATLLPRMKRRDHRRIALLIELARVNGLGRALKARRRDACEGKNARRFGIGDGSDPALLLEAAYRLIRKLAGRLEWQLEPDDQALTDALQLWLCRHRRHDPREPARPADPPP